MKDVCRDILRLLADKPGLTQHRIGIELSGSWGSSYVRSNVSELLHQGLIIADRTGKQGFALTISETGLRALSEAAVVA